MGTASFNYSQKLCNTAQFVSHLPARVRDLRSKDQVPVVLFSFPEGW